MTKKVVYKVQMDFDEPVQYFTDLNLLYEELKHTGHVVVYNASDAKYQQIEALYNSYQQQKANLSAATRAMRENEILEKESETVKFQESIFGNEGTMMKKRIELIQPIQERVFKAIESYAKENGFDLVLDIASNATMLYYSPEVNRTEAVIKLVK